MGNDLCLYAFSNAKIGDKITTEIWQKDWMTKGSDLAFTMEFSNPGNYPVPEPATFFLLGLGLIGIAGSQRKRFVK